MHIRQLGYFSFAISIFGGKYNLVQVGMNASTQNLTHSSFCRINILEADSTLQSLFWELWW